MSKREKRSMVILGGGPAGLGAAYMANRAGFKEWMLYERDEVLGGLSRSYVDDHRFTWDIGGHVTFSHYGLFTRLLENLLGPDNWYSHERECWIRMLSKWIPYPFQYNIHHLPEDIRAKCLEGVIEAASNASDKPCANFDEFIERTFGSGIAEIFMRPYNRKVWAYDPKELNSTWISERIAIPDNIRMTRNTAIGRDDLGWGPNSQFKFPKTGGTGAIWLALGDSLPKDNIVCGCSSTRIDATARIVTLSDGTTQPYDNLISTLPIDQLTMLMDRDDLSELARSLKHSSIYVIGVGLRGNAPDELSTKCWMYFPEDTVPFHRLTHFSHYSPYNVDDINRHWSIMAEVSESPVKPVDASRVASDTISSLVANGIVGSRKDVTHTWLHRVEYAYPTPSLDRDYVINALLPKLASLGIYSRGRFGAWRYEIGNMDHSFMQGLEASAHILHGTSEITLQNSWTVNQPREMLE